MGLKKEVITMKIKLKSFLICAIAPLMILTACNGNGNNELADPQDVNYDPVSFNGENPNMNENGNGNAGTNRDPGDPAVQRQGRNLFTQRYLIPMDPRNGGQRYAQRNEQGNQGNGQQAAQEPETPQQPADDNGQNAEAQNGNMDEYVQQVIDLTNGERKKNGLPALKPHAELSNVARIKSEDMVNKNYFSHTSPTYGSPFEMMENFGIEYSTAAENIAAGQNSPKEVVQAWMDSPGHRKNIMNNQVTHIGVGYAEDGGMGIYWTQMFIK
ncbi:serine protease [Rossellomorea vietnamensis]|uniref:Serine protease n=2 Tax=Rossellomorea vietnamensis TaxID=218284 RepID=A0A5D4NLW6_9BACI|nr:serine protease [Rossellomorea vietnamensis]